MKGDFSRNPNPLNYVSRVLQQQGRVQLDYDWNQQVASLLHYLQTLAADLIGPHGGPAGDSFKVKAEAGWTYDFSIQPGHYYVNGILCENTNKETVTAYSKQPDYPLSDTTNLKEGWYLVYLDVWERHLTYIEDDSIREVALGGPDTATRTKVVWQVKLAPVKADTTCEDTEQWTKLWAELVETWQPAKRGYLNAMAKMTNETESTDPCIIPPLAQYRGPENQLYRVEIHQGSTKGKSEPTFKWSRDNGSVASPIRALNGKMVTLEHLGLDARSSLQEEDWVEIVDDTYVLQGRTEPLLKVVSINQATMQVTLEKAPASNVGEDLTKHPLLRRWDHKKDPKNTNGSKADEKGVVIVENEWLHLEDGVHIQFQPGATYRTGDYWLIPARTATGDVEWPKDAKGAPQPMPPDGVEHNYAPLAIISVNDDGDVQEEYDCRRSFNSLFTLTELSQTDEQQ